MKQYRKQSRSYRRYILAGVLLTTGISLWASARTTNPGEALGSAISFINSGKLNEARSLLEIPLRNEELKHWAILMLGTLYEKQGKTDAAREEYLKIPSTVAAGVDARLGIIRISLETPELESTARDKLLKEADDLEGIITNAARKDLLEELLLVRAKMLARSDRHLDTFSAYSKLRTEFPNSRYIKDARQEQSRLKQEHQSLFDKEDAASLITQAKQLIKENSEVLALETAQAAKQQALTKTPEYFQAMLVEEEILRRMRRNEEADNLLALVSADAGPGLGDQALFKTVKNAWNINDHLRALELISVLENRFPKSSYRDETQYVKARVLEEMPSLTEAKDAYQQLAQSAAEPLLRIRAMRRVAWLHYASENYPLAAEFFDHAANMTNTAIGQRQTKQETLPTPEGVSSENRTTLPRLYDELYHAMYWRGQAISLFNSLTPETKHAADELARNILKELAKRNPYGYYGLLARIYLKEQTTQHFQQLPAENKDCFSEPGNTLLAQIAALNKGQDGGNLSELAEREINWYFYSRDLVPSSDDSPHAETIGKPLEKRAKDFLAKAKLFDSIAKYSLSLEQADLVLRLRPDTEIVSDISPVCFDYAARFAYPRPFQPTFKEAATQNGLSEALILAVARTESHFDVHARSSAGALGLTQLMPQTATLEGLGSEDNVFDPKVNIHLGAKHLARLKLIYGDNQVAIIAAYNAGQSAVNRWKSRYPDLDSAAWVELIGYPETARYVKLVTLAENIYTTTATTPLKQPN